MANAWSPRDVKLPTVQPITTNTVTIVSKPFSITAGGARYMRAAVKISGSNVTGSAAFRIETAMGANETFEVAAVNNVATPPDGWHFVDFIVSTELLSDVGRITINTAGGSTLTVDEVKVIQEQ